MQIRPLAVGAGAIGVLLVGCSTESPTTPSSRSSEVAIDGLLADGQLASLVATGPVGVNEAFWSGVPVPVLADNDAYLIESVEAIVSEGPDRGVRVGVTPTPLLGATQEPPDAYAFADLPYQVRSGDASSYLAIAAQPDEASVAKVVGLRVDAQLSDGREVVLLLPVAVAGCPRPIEQAMLRCQALSDEINDEMKTDRIRWGAYLR